MTVKHRPPLQSAAPHGTRTRYNYGCHCEPCRTADRRWIKERELRRLRGIEVPNEWVLAVGTQRRLRALMWMGHSGAYLAKRLGITAGSFTPLINDAHEYVYRGRAKEVEALFRELWDKQGPSSFTRLRAQRLRWASPLMWDNIDDPDEEPTPGIPMLGAIRPKDVMALLDAGMDREQIGEKLGLTREAVSELIEMHRAKVRRRNYRQRQLAEREQATA